MYSKEDSKKRRDTLLQLEAMQLASLQGSFLWLLDFNVFSSGNSSFTTWVTELID